MRRNSRPSGSGPEPRTRVVALSHVSNVSGLALPLPLIGARLAARGVPHFHVDGGAKLRGARG